ncbi:MAG: hypothetical protein ACOCSQ_05320, partial [Planctomycetota bacterium]
MCIESRAYLTAKKGHFLTDTIEDHATALEQPLDKLTQQAVETLESVLPDMESWTQKVRPDDGTRGRFRWAVETTRASNVAATACTLMGLERMGIKDRIWTEGDRDAGKEWIMGMHIGDQQYRDSALMDRPSPDWPEDEQWPSDAMLAAINQYARSVLEHSVDEMEELPPDSPPPGWPQANDDPAEMLRWVKTRPYDENAWSACSHGMRMATYMLRWHKEGKIPLQPVVDALTRIFHKPQALIILKAISSNLNLTFTDRFIVTIRQSTYQHGDRLEALCYAPH